MNKKMFLGSILCLTVLAVSACAAPVSTPNTTGPVNSSPAAGGATTPSTGISTIAPTPPVQGGANTGISTPAAPNVAVGAPGAGYVT